MIIRKTRAEEMDIVRGLFREYEKELGLDLCFQNFEEELKNLPGVYAEPQGVILLLEIDQMIAGVVALKPLEKGICEMKRLYLKPEYRRNGNGRKMAEEVISEASKKGYQTIKLDTLKRLEAAIHVYNSLGFLQTQAYNYNPDNTVQYFEKPLV